MEIQQAKISYTIKKTSEKQKKLINDLINNGVNDVMSHLYGTRGIDNFSDLNLMQKLEPFTNMLGVKEAAKILSKAILQKKKICVIADYDVDGATACAIAVRGIRLFGGDIDYVVPDRFIHGYGLTPSVVDEAIKRKNPDLLITVDNGISSHEGINYANKKGLGVIVTDHHLPGETLPNALCIVNPNQPDCKFKSKTLAGCGVMFYVLAGLRQHFIDLDVYTSLNAPSILSLLDLVAIGTIADVVKLDLNNRILVKLGLDLIRKKQTKAGVLSIIDVAKRKHDQLGTMDIGFGLGPRINAAGRLKDMTIGINCLLTDNISTANKLALELNSINKNRKTLETDMKELALDMSSLNNGEYSKVAFDESFHEGVIGIVASRIKDMFYRPTIVFAPSQEEGLIKGSGRSIPEVHLRDALDYVHKKDNTIIIKFGGHSAAAGLTIKRENLNKFIELFEEGVKYFSKDKLLLNIKEIDLDLNVKDINIKTAELIKDGIWGQGFPHPLFCGYFNIIDQKILKEEHLKISLEKDGEIFEGIWFFKNTEIESENVNIVYSLGVNEFMGNKKVQIMIENILE